MRRRLPSKDYLYLTCESFGHKLGGAGDGFWGVAKAGEPVHVWFAAKPCELTLGEVAMALLGRGYRCGFRLDSVEYGLGLAVA
jgi:hypothetical protein